MGLDDSIHGKRHVLSLCHEPAQSGSPHGHLLQVPGRVVNSGRMQGVPALCVLAAGLVWVRSLAKAPFLFLRAAALKGIVSCKPSAAVHVFGFNWSPENYHAHLMGLEQLVVDQMQNLEQVRKNICLP